MISPWLALAWTFALLSLAGAAYGAIAAVLVQHFAKRTGALPDPAFPVTLLKPLYGAEPQLLANLKSFCEQDYRGPVQIVFGVTSVDDPAFAAVQQVKALYPDRDIAVAVDSRQHGSNRKVSNLINMMSATKHDLLVLSDSDIAVPRDYLRQVTAAVQEPGVGAVTCLYRGEAGAGFWSKLGAMGISYQFLPNAVAGIAFKLATPCVGATIAIRRGVLDEIGGFAAVGNVLADDYEIGRHVRAKGYEVRAALPVVTHVSAERSAGELIAHEIRWARTIRTVGPFGHAGSLVTHSVPLALIAAGMLEVPAGLVPLGLSLLSRLILKISVDRALQRSSGPIWLLPFRDLLSFAVFAGSFAGRSVRWRDDFFRVGKSGTMSQL